MDKALKALCSSVAVISINIECVLRSILLYSLFIIGGNDKTFLLASRNTGYIGDLFIIGKYSESFLSCYKISNNSLAFVS